MLELGSASAPIIVPALSLSISKMTPPYPLLPLLPPQQQSPSISQSLLFHPNTISSYKCGCLIIIAHNQDFSTASSATHWQYLRSLQHNSRLPIRPRIPNPADEKAGTSDEKRVHTHSPLPIIYLKYYHGRTPTNNNDSRMTARQLWPIMTMTYCPLWPITYFRPINEFKHISHLLHVYHDHKFRPLFRPLFRRPFRPAFFNDPQNDLVAIIMRLRVYLKFY